MKNSEEMVNSLLERRDKYVAEKKKEKDNHYPYSNLDVLCVPCCLVGLRYVARRNVRHNTTCNIK